MRSLLLVVATVLPCAGAPAQQNPITNGGFEDVAGTGAPTDWEILGASRVETGEAHSGKRALHLVRTAEGGEVGLNRRWAPNSREQGGMLSARRGGIRFWYKAVAADPADALTLQVIPMNEKPLEVGGHRVVWRIPAQHLGDGRWHQGALAYNFEGVSEAKWVHVGAGRASRAPPPAPGVVKD